jgi:hypothetical protein
LLQNILEEREMKIIMGNRKMVGCYTSNDTDTHIGNMSNRKTACGKNLESTIFDDEVDVNCQKCLDKHQKKK